MEPSTPELCHRLLEGSRSQSIDWDHTETLNAYCIIYAWYCRTELYNKSDPHFCILFLLNCNMDANIVLTLHTFFCFKKKKALATRYFADFKI